MAPEPILLESIKSLTFYKDEMTSARRTSPIPQLTCIGKACALYQPEAVQCVNTGGTGVDINWKCEADLPAALRFGRISVGCEGWSRSGDPYVLKGSCGLEYRLIQVPNQFNANPDHSNSSSWSSFKGWSAIDMLYYAFWIGILVWMLWAFLKPCIPSLRSSRNTPNRRPGGGSRPNTYPGSGGGYSSSRHNPPPPPYSERPPKDTSSSSGSGRNWQPGFWTGLGLGAAGTYLATGRNQNNNPQYDWERSQFAAAPQPSARQASSNPPASSYRAMGQGEGSSSGGGSLGPTRRATGYGGTNVR
ncbi:hypothetical protein M407DRAFT_88632 [Tulasnella calospora MUT 4182]|uniref:Store-operated calcium entry-associated regulatory factor n=1 Tax=Tulasnella calospora MUT 4182 TaxID=1051891 RepID=A0A0C3LKG5_9AGAM|nr:hypothetical protein M407DRAFT_88632 [Tulasnella calospora MUT 4182]